MGSANSQDIQLCGMAIQAEHCVIDITETDGVVLSPHRSARYVLERGDDTARRVSQSAEHRGAAKERERSWSTVSTNDWCFSPLDHLLKP